MGWKRWLPPFLLCLVVIAGLLPAISIDYAFSDDYAYLYWGNAGSCRIFYEVCTLYGRPLLGPLLLPPFIWIDTVPQVLLLRLVGVAGVLVFALCGARLMSRALAAGPVSSGLFGLLLALNPGMAYEGMWAACFPYPLCSALALLVGYWLAGALRGALSAGRLARILGCLAAVCVILNVYQPAAMIALVGGYLGCLERRAAPARPILFLAAIAGAFGAYYLLTKLVVLPWVFGGHLPAYASRYGVNLSLGRLVGYSFDTAFRGLSLWGELRGGAYGVATAACAAALVAVGLRALGGGSLRGTLARAGIFLLFLGLALGPLVVNTERAYYSRTLIAFYGLLFVPIVAGLRGLCGGRRLAMAACALAMGALFAGSSFYYTRQTALNAHWEHAVLAQVAASGITPKTRSVLFIRPQYRSMRRTPELTTSDHWGMLSSWVEMFPKPMLQQIVDEQFGGSARAPQLTLYSVRRGDPRPQADFTIDGPSLFGGGSLGLTGPLIKQKARVRTLLREP